MADNELEEGEAGQGLNPIACSYCRQRKRKCDRQLPHCLQCRHDPSNCHYPEQNKRGIPIGFINRLEARLVETEDALYRVLQFIDQRSVDEPNSLHHSRQSKADRIKEWDSLPLQSMDEIHQWYQQRIGATPSSAGDLSIDNPPPSTTWPPPTINQMVVPVPIREMPESEVQQPIIVNTGQPVSASDGDSMLEGSWELNQSPSESKAKDLGEKHPHLYF